MNDEKKYQYDFPVMGHTCCMPFTILTMEKSQHEASSACNSAVAFIQLPFSGTGGWGSVFNWIAAVQFCGL